MHLRDALPTPLIAFITWVGSTTLLTALFWIIFGSCVATMGT